MTRPTLYIDHPATLTAQARRGEIPLRGLYCGMAGYSRYGGGRVSALAPDHADVLDVLAGRLPFDLYARRCLAKWGEADLRPGHLLTEHGATVPDGAGLYCECARPGSKSRRHPCHRELWPLVLVPAGWDVVLYGRRITLALATVGPHAGEAIPVYADGDDAGAHYDPAAFGWPNNEERTS